MTSFLYKNKKIAGVSFQVPEKNAEKTNRQATGVSNHMNVFKEIRPQH